MGELLIEEDNVIELATFVATGLDLHSKTAIRTLADVTGKVFAAQNAAGAKALETLGANASLMVGPDANLALQRGSVDGVLCARGWVNKFKRNEVTTYHTLPNRNPGTYSSVMNKATWSRLTPEQQAHLAAIVPLHFFYNTTDSAAAAIAGIPPESILTQSAEDRASLIETIHPLWSEWVAEADARGWPGQEILDPAVRLSDRYDQN